MFGAAGRSTSFRFSSPGFMATSNTEDVEGTENQPATDTSEVTQGGSEDGVSQTLFCDSDDASDNPSRGKGDFGEKGKFDDEVTLRFDDADEMYVSMSFLKLSSPVFTRMLEADFKEKATRVVELKGKDPDDFLELLWFLHPAIQKRITESTVFRILPLAEEYEVKTAISDCKAMMKKLLDGAVLPEQAPLCDHCPASKKPPATAVGFSFGAAPHASPPMPQSYVALSKPVNRSVITTDRRHVKSLHDCFKVFEAAVQFLYGEFEDDALKIISKYPATMYTQSSAPKEYANIDCFKQYNRLDDQEKSKVLNGRLDVRDDVCNIDYISPHMFWESKPM